MTYPEPRELVKFPGNTPPQLVIVIDVEEEFDWTKPFSRNETSVTNVDELWRIQEIFDRHNIVPTYMVDYPAATTSSSVKVIKDIFDDGRCDIGTQLHPWVNPPFDEDVCIQNSFPGNLPKDLEFAKLSELTNAIVENFGTRPVVYRAGRYGFGPNTTDALEKLNYEIDLSIVPHTSFAEEGGPDYTSRTPDPFWFGTHSRLLAIPLTCGFSGALSSFGETLFPVIGSKVGEALRVKGAAARIGLLDRIRLSPEGMTLAEMKKVTQQLLNEGTKTYQLTFHSSSLKLGSTEYVRTESEREEFLKRLDDFLEWFLASAGQQTKPTIIRSSFHGASDNVEIDPPIVSVETETSYTHKRRHRNDKLIWLVGMPRSGTSWIGKILDSHPYTLYRHEPDTELKPGDNFSLLDPTLVGVTAHEADNFLDKVLSIRSERVSGKLPIFPKSYYSPAAYAARWCSIYMYKFMARWGYRPNLPELVNRKYLDQVRLVWKSINGTGSLGAFAELMPGCNVVHIVRHPCGHVASVLKGENLRKFSSSMPASEDIGIYRSLAKTDLAKRHQVTLESFLQMAPIERIAWRWALFNEKAFEEGQKISNYTLLHYDQFCAAPGDNAKTLFETLNLGWNSTTESFLGKSTDTNDEDYYSLQKDPMIAANKWQTDLTSPEIEQVLEIARKCMIGREIVGEKRYDAVININQ